MAIRVWNHNLISVKCLFGKMDECTLEYKSRRGRNLDPRFHVALIWTNKYQKNGIKLNREFHAKQLDFRTCWCFPTCAITSCKASCSVFDRMSLARLFTRWKEMCCRWQLSIRGRGIIHVNWLVIKCDDASVIIIYAFQDLNNISMPPLNQTWLSWYFFRWLGKAGGSG